MDKEGEIIRSGRAYRDPKTGQMKFPKGDRPVKDWRHPNAVPRLGPDNKQRREPHPQIGKVRAFTILEIYYAIYGSSEGRDRSNVARRKKQLLATLGRWAKEGWIVVEDIGNQLRILEKWREKGATPTA